MQMFKQPVQRGGGRPGGGLGVRAEPVLGVGTTVRTETEEFGDRVGGTPGVVLEGSVKPLHRGPSIGVIPSRRRVYRPEADGGPRDAMDSSGWWVERRPRGGSGGMTAL